MFGVQSTVQMALDLPLSELVVVISKILMHNLISFVHFMSKGHMLFNVISCSEFTKKFNGAIKLGNQPRFMKLLKNHTRFTSYEKMTSSKQYSNFR